MKNSTHVGVYALTEKEGSMLFIKKARGPYTGKWDLPGGGFELGESPLEALHREFTEETGLTISKATLLNVLSHTETYENIKGEQEAMHHIGILYHIEIGADEKGLKRGSDGEDSLGAKWLESSTMDMNDFSPFANQCNQYIQN